MPSPYAGLERSLVTAEFDQNTAADHVVKAVPLGLRFFVYQAYLQNDTANAVEVVIKSGSTAIARFDVPTTSAADNVREFRNAPLPIWEGISSGDDLVITLPGTDRIYGWLNYALADHTRSS